MTPNSLRSRFVVTSLVILLATVITGLWSWIVFVRLGLVVDAAMEGRQTEIDLTAGMATALEREDDALLLALAGDPRAHGELDDQRRAFDFAFERYGRVVPSDERASVERLRGEVAAYRRAGNELLRFVGSPAALPRYHDDVNPTLRRASGTVSSLREHSFRALRDAGDTAREQATKGTWMVALVSIAALTVATLVLMAFARSVLRPIRAMTKSVDAMRRGDFQQRVERATPDELANLTDGFNRMAESLVIFQTSNLGEVMRAKDTLEATMSALPDPVIVIDPEGNIASLNPPARGVLPDIEIAAPVETLPESAARRGRAVLDGVPAARPDLRDAFVLTLGGERRTFLPTAVPIPSVEGRSGAVAVLHDITEFVRVDTLRSELIAVASHELKTPLTTLRLNLLLLGEEVGNLSKRHREILGMAVQGCEELARTIDRLLDLTRIEAGKLRLAMERVDLYRMIGEVMTSLAPRFGEAEIEVEIVRSAADACVRGDPLRLAVVMSNLLTNAIKYTQPGGTVAITVSPRALTRVEVSVADNGSGVPADLRERVFEKFFRVAHVRPDTNDATGAGIGLYVCRQIIEAHGGDITCDPAAAGAVFTFRLDADPTDPSH